MRLLLVAVRGCRGKALDRALECFAIKVDGDGVAVMQRSYDVVDGSLANFLGRSVRIATEGVGEVVERAGLVMFSVSQPTSTFKPRELYTPCSLRASER